MDGGVGRGTFPKTLDGCLEHLRTGALPETSPGASSRFDGSQPLIVVVCHDLLGINVINFAGTEEGNLIDVYDLFG